MGVASELTPKPMLTIGGRPLLWHLMHIFAAGGSDEFVLALGHLGHVIKDFFLRFEAYAGDFRIQLGDGARRWLTEPPEAGWHVSCIDTGEDAGTGARLRSVAPHVPDWPVVVGYGDVLADVDVAALVRYHRAHGRLATVTAVRPPSNYGVLTMGDDRQITRFDEKTVTTDAWVSAGYFVLERAVFEDYIPTQRDVMFEEEPVRRLVKDGQLVAYPHEGYWQPVDTLKDLQVVRAQWDSGEAPWQTWHEPAGINAPSPGPTAPTGPAHTPRTPRSAHR